MQFPLMIIPCIDLMGGKVVQLRQGREKALEGEAPGKMLERFAGFPVIQVIDLDAAMGQGSNDELVRFLAARTAARVGGGATGPMLPPRAGEVTLLRPAASC